MEVAELTIAGIWHQIIFHGDKRAESLQSLHGKDLVLTTYHTLISDWNANRLLYQYSWNRIVLDEGTFTRTSSLAPFRLIQP